MKTSDEIYNLKMNWQADPCWDIEYTEGFEAHIAELLTFRVESETLWRANAAQCLHDYADKIGVPDNLKLAAYIRGLEKQIDRLNERE